MESRRLQGAVRRDPARRERGCGRRPAHLHGRCEEGRASHRHPAVQVPDLREARQGARRRSEQQRSAEVSVSRERGRPGQAAVGQPARRLRDHRQGQEGRVDRPESDGACRHEAVLHVLDSSVDASRGRRHLRFVVRGRVWARALAVAGVLTLSGFGIYEAAFAEGAPGGRTIDYWVAAVPVVWNMAPKGDDSAGVWPYHDHSPSMMDSIEGGMYGMLSILGRHERAPDREFEVVLAPMGKFMTIDGRAFVGNTPVFRAKVGQLVQWDVMAMGSDFHTFHVHGHRWMTPGGVSRDTQTVGPAESFRIQWREDAPGTWLYHCHVEDHMAHGMIGIYRVSR